MEVIQNLLIVGLSLSQATLILSLEFPKIKIEKNYSGFLFMTTGATHYRNILCLALNSHKLQAHIMYSVEGTVTKA